MQKSTLSLTAVFFLILSPLAMAEPGQRAQQRFSAMDANGDGLLSPAEMQQARAARFRQLDADGDGELRREELRAGREHAQRRAGSRKGGTWMRRFDADRSGGLSAEEYGTAGEQRFQRLDRDGDGNLSMRELRQRPCPRRAVRQATVAGGAAVPAAPAGRLAAAGQRDHAS